MDSPSSKESEVVNEKGEVEIKVDTVDYQTLPGQGQQKRDVQVIHKTSPSGNSTTAAGGLVASTAATVGVAIQAAKDAVSGK